MGIQVFSKSAAYSIICEHFKVARNAAIEH